MSGACRTDGDDHRRAADPARADRACGMVGFALKIREKIYIILIL